MPVPRINGTLINLRPLRKSDAASIQRYANDRQVERYLLLLPHPYGLEDAHAFIRRSQAAIRRRTNFAFGIEEPSSGDIIGIISLDNLNWDDRNTEVGYWLGRRFWRRGYMTEALRLILGYAFRELGLMRVYAQAFRFNVASARLLERVGFTHEGTMRQARFKHNRFNDMLSFGMLRREFKG